MAQIQTKDLLDAGVHFGHLTRKWDPRMASYIFMEKNGIHIIDLNQSVQGLERAQAFVKGIARSGKKIMFVATKKQAQEIVSEEAKRLKMPFVTERWLGGMLTNFSTIRKSLKKMNNIERMLSDEQTAGNLAKRERLMLNRDRIKLERLLGGVADMSRIPAALFVVDIKREHLAISEAHRLGIPVVAMVDTNSNPEEVDYVIPANDDAYKSISLITLAIGKAIEEGILERKSDKETAEQEEIENAKRAMDMGKAVEEAPVAAASDDDSETGGKRKRTRTTPKAEDTSEEAAPVAEVAEEIAALVEEAPAEEVIAEVEAVAEVVETAPVVEETSVVEEAPAAEPEATEESENKDEAEA